MRATLEKAALEQSFVGARTFNRFTAQPVSDETLKQIHELMKWGPTSMNSQPARFVFVRTPEARARLKPALAAGNLEKTMVAPVTVIVAWDSRFYEFLPQQFPAYDAKPMFEASPTLAETTAFRNGTLQGGYFILAARMLGLDCGPMSGFDNAKVDAEFFPDRRWRSNFLINLGYGDPAGNYPRGPRLSFDSVAHVL